MPADLTVTLSGAPVPVYLGDNAAITSARAAEATAAAQQAAASEAVALAAAGPNYASTAAGLAATSVGETFAVEVDGIVTVYRHDTGPTATELRVLPTTAALGSPEGAGMLGFEQAEAGASPSTLLAEIRRMGYRPEQFGAVGDGATDDTAAMQACFDAAANWPSAGRANEVILTKLYKTTATILKRPYVSVRGIGMGRCGLLPTLSSGPALDCDIDVNTSSSYLDQLTGFRIDGTNCSGTAYALRLRGQKHTRFNQVGFWNFLNTSEHAVQILDLGYAITFDQCYWFQNRQHEKFATSIPASVFVTTVTHIACTFEAENIGSAWAHEAIHISDASGITYDLNCIFQRNDQKYLFLVENGATPTTQSVHRWTNSYFEDNGGGQAGAQTWRMVGLSANLLTRCIISGNKVHGAAPDGGHIYAEYTQDLAVRDNHVPANHTWLVDGGNNAGWDVDARSVGACGLQTTFYNLTGFVFTDTGTVTEHSGIFGVDSIVKQSTGRWDITLDRALLSTAAIVTVTAFDAGGDALAASGYFTSTTVMQVRVNAIGTITAATPSRVTVQFIADIGPLS